MNRGLCSCCAPPTPRGGCAQPDHGADHTTNAPTTPPTPVMHSRLITEARPDAQRARTVRSQSTRANRSLRKRPPPAVVELMVAPTKARTTCLHSGRFSKCAAGYAPLATRCAPGYPTGQGCAVGVADGVCAPSRMPAQLDGKPIRSTYVRPVAPPETGGFESQPLVPPHSPVCG